MASAIKKIQKKRSLIKLLDKQKQPKWQEQKFKTISTDKEKRKSGIGSASKTRRQKDEMKDLLKQSYMFVKEQNQSLACKLRKKMRRIQQMKDTIRNLQDKIQQYQSVVKMLRQGKTTSKTRSAQQSLKGSRKYQDIIKQSQQIAKLSLEKYKNIEKEMQLQKIKYSNEINKLKDTNEALKKQILLIKSENSDNAISKKKKSRSEHKKIDKIQHSQENLNAQIRALREKQKIWIVKEGELKRMLTQINNKINHFEVNCLLTEEKANKYKAQIDRLQQKYDIKCRKNRQSNQKWHSIFKEFMKQTQNAGKDIENIKKLLLDILKQFINKYSFK